MLWRHARLVALAALVAAIVAGGMVFAYRHFSAPGGLVVYVPIESSQLTVQIDGGVARPGVYRLPRGQRIADAVSAAGGLTDDASPSEINLAARLHDGQHIRIPFDGESSPAGSEERVNINTASADVLACIPGIGQDFAGAMVAYRIQNPDSLDSITWVRQVVDDDKKAIEAGPYITVKTYQISADVAAVGHNGRGLRRTRFVFDLTGSEPTIVYRRDETRLGWPLGAATRENLISGEQAPQVQG